MTETRNKLVNTQIGYIYLDTRNTVNKVEYAQVLFIAIT